MGRDDMAQARMKSEGLGRDMSNIKLTDGKATRWFILRTSGPSTMRLAASLQDAAIEAWTPTEHIRRRVPRSKNTEFRIVPLAPTYVFVRGDRLDEMQRIERAEVTPHPAFSIFRHCGKTVFVRHSNLHPMRLIEQDSYRRSLPASGRRPMKKRGERYEVGDAVKLTMGAFAGFEAFIESSDGLVTTLKVGIFGRPTEVKVPTLQLREASVSVANTAA
ncbi:transcription termination/antitermination protein NusG [Sphingomonas sp. LC-1]|uniref:transcription termination/antitermination protein NusG n=1 Tax=Sphingomonas sp. LC-1 TaxID=3110957 RepID=UPI0021BB8312|nr:transcription termination/antitermination NusG family protein [Sphingomonas sp. LC-1]